MKGRKPGFRILSRRYSLESARNKRLASTSPKKSRSIRRHDACETKQFGTYKRGGPADDLALGVVLRPVARAHELVLCLVPWDHTTQVSAHSVDSEAGNREVLLHAQVGRVTLQRETRVQVAVTSKLASFHVAAFGSLA